MQEKILVKKFEQLNNLEPVKQCTSLATQLSIDLGKTAMSFSRIDRVPRYADSQRENNAEHSYMLALVAPEIADALELPLDTGLVCQFATVHDLVELKTGDIATFLFDEGSQTEKETNEHAVLQQLLAELPPHTAMLLERYESQAEPEARFVRYIDKLLPIVVDIIGDGERVMREDYNIQNIDMLRVCHENLHTRLVKKFGNEFPEIDLAHRLLCELFESKFATQ